MQPSRNLRQSLWKVFACDFRWLTQPESSGDSNVEFPSVEDYVIDKNSPDGESDPVVTESSSYFYTYTTVQSVSVWKCEFSPRIRDSFQAWNQTIYYWMDSYVYQRCQGPRLLRSVVTLFIYAYCFGVQPNHLLAVITLPLISQTEEGIATLMAFFGFVLPPGGLAFIRWFFRRRALDYLTVGWILLSLEETLAFWGSLGYFVHVAGFVAALAHLALSKFVSAFERWQVENPGEDVAVATARNLSQTGKAWEGLVVDTIL
ncbi:unnamed protein product [Mesocestoides corti]|uniref:Lysophospholipid acyltransferase 7 n=2 Tax=Mesocestoides corti TaxID=53468 RepID=A0A3P6HXU8_MESCO|nr:unnamed protein product [Mesocestoides corti]